MGRKIIYILAVFAVFATFSCTKQDRENSMANQESAIDSYISSLSDVAVVRNSGSNRVVLQAGKEGTDAAVGDSLYIRYAGYIFSRGKGTLFATNDSTIAGQTGYPQQAPLAIKLGSSDLIRGLRYGLEGVKEGEHCYIIFSAKYGFDNVVVYNIPKLSPLFFEVWVDRVIN